MHDELVGEAPARAREAPQEPIPQRGWPTSLPRPRWMHMLVIAAEVAALLFVVELGLTLQPLLARMKAQESRAPAPETASAAAPAPPPAEAGGSEAGVMTAIF